MNKYILMAMIILIIITMSFRVVEGIISKKSKQYWMYSLNIALLLICCHDVKSFNL